MVMMMMVMVMIVVVVTLGLGMRGLALEGDVTHGTRDSDCSSSSSIRIIRTIRSSRGDRCRDSSRMCANKPLRIWSSWRSRKGR